MYHHVSAILFYLIFQIVWWKADAAKWDWQQGITDQVPVVHEVRFQWYTKEKWWHAYIQYHLGTILSKILTHLYSTKRWQTNSFYGSQLGSSRQNGKQNIDETTIQTKKDGDFNVQIHIRSVCLHFLIINRLFPACFVGLSWFCFAWSLVLCPLVVKHE